MTVSFKIKNLPARIALAGAVLLSGLGFVGIILSHFIVRTMADHRLAIRQEALANAAVQLPNSPRVQSRMAEAEIAESADARILAQAQMHSTTAVNLSPWDYRGWQKLGATQELLNKPEDAEKSLRTAARLAPNYAEVNWALANLLMRQGKVNESLASFRAAFKVNGELFPQALDLLWQASGGNVALLQTLADGNARMQLELTKFLAEQSQADSAIAIFRSIDARAKMNSQSAAAFISMLLKVNPQVARALWLETVKTATGQATADELIWNGGFEPMPYDSLKQFNHFDWMISPSDYARIGFDRGVAHSGGRSLKVSFAGRDTTAMEGEIRQQVALKPGARYRLECYAKAQNLVTPEGPRLALLAANSVAAVSDPVVADSNEWQRLMVSFVAPPEMTTYVTIVRKPRFSYEAPTRGTIWFDDFKLMVQ